MSQNNIVLVGKIDSINSFWVIRPAFLYLFTVAL